MSDDKERDVDPDEGSEERTEEKPEEKPSRRRSRPERALPRDKRALEALGPERTLGQQVGMPAFFAGLLALILGIGWAVIIHTLLKPGPIICLAGGIIMLLYGIAVGLLPLLATLHGRGSLVVLMATGLTAALLLLLVGLNLLSLARRIKFDMTKDRYYSLTSESKSILKNVKKDVKITLVVATNQLQFAQYNIDDLKRLMREYEYNSPHVKWELVDLYRNPKKAEELGGISFGGKALVQCEGRKEEVSLSRDNEEGLTTAIYRVTKPQKDVIYYLTGHGEVKPDSFGSGEEAASEFRKALDNLQMDVKELVLARGEAGKPGMPEVKIEGGGPSEKKAAQDVPPDAKALLVLGPQTPLTQKEIDAIRRYTDLPGSGTLIALSYKPGAPDFRDILSKYKVDVRPGVVIDPYKSLDGALVPVVERPQGHEILDRVSFAYLPWSRGFKIEQQAPPENPYGQPPPEQAAKALLQTSDQSWLETSELKKGAKIGPSAGEDRGPLTVAVVVDTKKEKPPTPPGMPEPPEPETGPGSRLVVLGSALMLTDEAQKWLPVTTGGNLTFAAHIVSWLTGGAPVSVPQKKPYTFTVSYSRVAQIILSILLIFVIPLGTVVIGIVIWWMRR
jgi:gliding motility-associatede transport system auxiliary component